MLTYAADRLWEETTFVAYYLHWPFDTILDLAHPDRARVIEEIGKINSKLSQDDDY
ncbi:DUF6760 family protein [Streptomyces vinaceus]|uniref:DUF6760 family protein n=1 Tax=Streptomyces vinaceus TaxID=1960 RepID=UPI00380564DF